MISLAAVLMGLLFAGLTHQGGVELRAADYSDLYGPAAALSIGLVLGFLWCLRVSLVGSLWIFLVSLPVMSRVKVLVFMDLGFVYVTMESVLILALGLAAFIRVHRQAGGLRAHNPHRLVLAVFLVLLPLAAALSGRASESTATMIEGYLLPVCLYFSAVVLISNLEEAKLIIWALIISGAIASAYALVQFVINGPNDRVVAMYYNPNILATLLATTVPLVLVAIRSGHCKAVRIAGAVTLALMCMVVVLTQSRGAVLALACCGAAYIVMARRGHRRLVIYVGVALLCLLPFRNPIFDSASRRPAFLLRNNPLASDAEGLSKARWSAAQASFRMIADQPFGIGPGMFNYAYPAYIQAGSGDYFMEDAHNVFLNIFVEAGVGGGLCFLVFFRSLLWRTAKAARAQDQDIRDLALGCFLSLLSFGILSLTTGEQLVHKHMANVGYVFFVVAALATTATREFNARRRSAPASGALR